jgi:hypothetical protein
MTDDDLDWEILSIYTRREALADGVQRDVSNLATEAGIRYPVFITQSAYAEAVTVPPGVQGQDEPGRLWDVLWMLAHALRQTKSDSNHLVLELSVCNSNEGEPALVRLSVVCGPMDFDNPKPALTIMMPGED